MRTYWVKVLSVVVFGIWLVSCGGDSSSKSLVWLDQSTGLMWQNESYYKEFKIYHDDDDTKIKASYEVKYDRDKRTYEKNGYGKRGNWSYAMDYCANLKLEEYDDWRLPSYDELKSIKTKEKTNTNYKDMFGDYEYYYIKKELLDSISSKEFDFKPFRDFWSSDLGNVNYHYANAYYISYETNFGDSIEKRSQRQRDIEFIRCVRAEK